MAVSSTYTSGTVIVGEAAVPSFFDPTPLYWALLCDAHRPVSLWASYTGQTLRVWRRGDIGSPGLYSVSLKSSLALTKVIAYFCHRYKQQSASHIVLIHRDIVGVTRVAIGSQYF